MANARGGWLVMGIDDTTYTPVGVNHVKYAVDNLIQASRLVVPSLRFDPLAPEVVAVYGRQVVVAYVPPRRAGSTRPAASFGRGKGPRQYPWARMN